MGTFSRKRTPGELWTVYALLSPNELSQAFGDFPTLCIYKTNGRIPANETGSISVEEYISNYEKYIERLTGEQEFDRSVQGNLYVSLSLDATIFADQPCPETHFKVVRYSKPVVQVQELELAYLSRANKVRANCMDVKNPLHFGLMFSHHNVWNVHRADPTSAYDLTRFPNIALIEGLTEWIKAHSRPCKLMVRGKEQTLGVRLGQEVLRWINEHDGLAKQSIVVKTGQRVTPEKSWLTPTVLRLAKAINEERTFKELPVLADALEEAGCTDAEVLAHCHSPKPHRRGCWVVDLLLSTDR
jgi:hypothetical protein